MTQRYYSLDVFRGATVALMILVNNPGTWAHIYDPLEHAPWHGVTPTDLVFPFFLFAVGNAMAFVMPRLEAAGPATFWKKVIKRTLLIFGIGLFLQWYPFVQWQGDALVLRPWSVWDANDQVWKGVRVMGVLQRIALAYFFASIIVFYFKTRGAFLIGLIILLFYWLMTVLGNPADPYSLTGWFGTHFDLAVFGEAHMYKGEKLNGKPFIFDPEGLISTIPAIVQVIFGFIIGDYIRKRNSYTASLEDAAIKNLEIYRSLTILFLAAVAFLFAGYVWGLSFPMNKKIWTSSYVIYTTGLAVIIITTLIYAIEVKKIRGWFTHFFDVFGKNALFIFAFSSFLPKTLRLIRWQEGITDAGKPKYLDPWSWWYQKVWANVPGAKENGSLLFAISVIIIFWAICYWMDKKKIYIKV